MRFHYFIRDINNKEVHTSKEGVPGQKGFPDPVKADFDGHLIMDMKYPEGGHYVHVYPEEEATGKCSICGAPANHKVGEEFSVLDPRAFGHNLTNDLCENHFNMVICPYKDNPLKELRKRIEAIVAGAAGKPGVQNDYEHGKHTAGNMILDDLNELFGEGVRK